MTFDPLIVAAAVSAVSALLCAWASIAVLRRRPRGVLRLGAGGVALLLALALLAGGALCGALAVSLSGYRALTREELAATVRTTPTGPQSFEAHFAFPDGREARYELAGDQFAVEARILKWHPWANLLGLHTAYELDRVTGRYAAIEDEQQRPRTVFSLAPEHAIDLLAWRARLPWLAPFVDAEYGSSTFTRADHLATYEVMVSTTGLLVRELALFTADRLSGTSSSFFGARVVESRAMRISARAVSTLAVLFGLAPAASAVVMDWTYVKSRQPPATRIRWLLRFGWLRVRSARPRSPTRIRRVLNAGRRPIRSSSTTVHGRGVGGITRSGCSGRYAYVRFPGVE